MKAWSSHNNESVIIFIFYITCKWIKRKRSKKAGQVRIGGSTGSITYKNRETVNIQNKFIFMWNMKWNINIGITLY